VEKCGGQAPMEKKNADQAKKKDPADKAGPRG
jgi:hypothetical protein